jgi:hypothetical protein
LLPDDLIGSPSAAKSHVLVKLENGNVLRTAETVSYPNFTPLSVFREPKVSGYWRMTFPGKAYVTALAVDAEGQVGHLHDDAVAIADRVDAGGGSPLDQSERLRILTFFVRPAPATASMSKR